MLRLRKLFAASPLFARLAPFLIFVAITFLQDRFGQAPRYWFYVAKTVVGAWLVWEMRPFVSEMRWKVSWEAIVVGVAVCAIWIGLDNLYPKIGKSGPPWNPNLQFGHGSGLAWTLVAVRILGSTLVVPPLEEVFYRSLLYRYLVTANFLGMPLRQFHAISFVATSLIFGFAHYQWLAGILCGAAYQGLVLRKDRLGDAMTAHAITNFLLGVWVVTQNAWQFW